MDHHGSPWLRWCWPCLVLQFLRLWLLHGSFRRRLERESGRIWQQCQDDWVMMMLLMMMIMTSDYTEMQQNLYCNVNVFSVFSISSIIVASSANQTNFALQELVQVVLLERRPWFKGLHKSYPVTVLRASIALERTMRRWETTSWVVSMSGHWKFHGVEVLVEVGWWWRWVRRMSIR